MTKRRRKNTMTQAQQLHRARLNHERFLSTHGLTNKTRPRLAGVAFPELSVPLKKGVAPMSNKIPGGAAPVRDKLSDHKWRSDSKESSEAIAEAEDKAKRIVPDNNKGGYVYQSPEALLATVKGNQRRPG